MKRQVLVTVICSLPSELRVGIDIVWTFSILYLHQRLFKDFTHGTYFILMAVPRGVVAVLIH